MKRHSRLLLNAAAAAIILAAALNIRPVARASDVSAPETMPVAQQNALIRKQCASCHSDALNYGGLTLEHFDTAHPDPTVAAMLVSKITNGYSPREVNAATRDPQSEAGILSLLRTGAMTAGGPLPDERTQLAFARALSAESAGAEEWHVEKTEDSATHSGVLTAAILRQVPAIKYGADRTDMYRVILSCRTATRDGEIKLTWANGVPEEGREMTFVVDGKTSFNHKLTGGNQQGNGVNGPGATILYPGALTNTPLPSKSLTIANIFPDEMVIFPFDNLSPSVRGDLAACFGAENATH